MMFFDPMYFAILAPALLLAAYATIKVRGNFAKYSRVRSASGMTGARVAEKILRKNNLYDVEVVETAGALSDHYDPRTRTVRLSPEVYRSPSVASVAVAAHEVGHALQHAKHYAPLSLRSAAVPMARLGSYAPWIIMVGGYFLQMIEMVYFGVFLFAGMVVFQLITLPVEFNASSRAKDELQQMGLVSASDANGVNKVLSAAAMTYVAAAITSILTLMYYLLRLGILGGGRDD